MSMGEMHIYSDSILTFLMLSCGFHAAGIKNIIPIFTVDWMKCINDLLLSRLLKYFKLYLIWVLFRRNNNEMNICFAPQVFSSSPTCCLCSLVGFQSSSWRLHLDSSWNKEGSLPGTLHPSLKVPALVSDVRFTVTTFLYVAISPPGGPSCLPQVWAWLRWWLCSSVTLTTSWSWFGGSIFSSTPSPPRCPGPPAGTLGTPQTARRISDVPATTVVLPSPCRQSPLPVCSPPHPWWTCL